MKTEAKKIKAPKVVTIAELHNLLIASNWNWSELRNKL